MNLARFILLGFLVVSFPVAGSDSIAPSDVRAAVTRALVYLERDGIAWLDQRKCISCHHGPFLLQTHHEALRRGFAVDRDKLAAWEARIAEMYLKDRLKFEEKKGGQIESMNLLLGHFGSQPRWPFPDNTAEVEWIATAGRLLVGAQRDDGGWSFAGQVQARPQAEADEATTGWGILASTGLATKQPALASARTRAAAWLARQPRGETNESLVARLLVAVQVEDRDSIAALRTELKARQRSDGGWSWSSQRESDPYATGQSLFALSAAGDLLSAPEVQSGVRFLLDRQCEDGSWSAPTKKSKGEDAIASFWGSAWGTLGLLGTLASD